MNISKGEQDCLQANIKRVSPWSWLGFETIEEKASVGELMGLLLANRKIALDLADYTDSMTALHHILTNTPLNKKLETDTAEATKEREPKREEKRRPPFLEKQLKEGLKTSWTAEQIGRLLVKYESEWYADESLSKWNEIDAFYEEQKEQKRTTLVDKLTEANITKPAEREYALSFLEENYQQHISEWQIEKEKRIKPSLWWSDVVTAQQAQTDSTTEPVLSKLPADGKVWYLHPVGMLQHNIGKISLREAQEIALKVTTFYEGGHTLNYKALAGNFDGQGMSFGLIQWNLGSGTLGPVLLEMRAEDTLSFDNCFAAELNLSNFIIALEGRSIERQRQWAINAQRDNNQAWKRAFSSLGEISSFNEIQFKHATKYHKNVIKCINKMRELNSNLMSEIEIRTYVALFDLGVQQGDLNRANSLIESEYQSDNVITQTDLLRFVCQKRALTANQLYVADCMSRRLGIIEGRAVEYEHSYQNSQGETKTRRALRENPNLSLIIEGVIDETL